jgi:hypothetical protein
MRVPYNHSIFFNDPVFVFFGVLIFKNLSLRRDISHLFYTAYKFAIGVLSTDLFYIRFDFSRIAISLPCKTTVVLDGVLGAAPAGGHTHVPIS